MSIEFHCPGCGKLMRTPDATAGRKGQCPHCGTKVQIPTSSLTTSEKPLPPASPARPPAPAANRPAAASVSGADMIRFTCTSCGRTLSVPASSAGKQSRCPGCNAVSQVPGAKPTGAKTVGPRTAAPASPTPGPLTQFACPSCRKAVRVAVSTAGSRGQCPHCGAVLVIPGAGGASPKAAPSSGLAPLGPGDGLTPLPSRGTDDLFAGLPDLSAGNPGAFGGLEGGNPFAAAGGSGGWSGGMPAANPYAAPLPAARPRSTGHTNKPKRSGLPWDDREHEDSPFWSTVQLVLFSPTQAFYRMRRKGGLGGPLLFCITGVMLGALITMGYNLLIQLASIGLALSRAPNAPPSSFYVMVAISFAGLLVGTLVGAVIGAVTGAFLNGALIHLFLKLVDGTDYPFEVTFRVVCYTLGSTAMYQLLPLCGGIVGVVANLVTLIIGMYAAHETSGGKAALGVLLPMITCCALAGLLVFMMFGLISSMMPANAR